MTGTTGAQPEQRTPHSLHLCSASELPKPEVSLELKGYPLYTTPVLEHTLQPRWAPVLLLRCCMCKGHDRICRVKSGSEQYGAAI